MKTLTVLMALVASQVLCPNCYSQVEETFGSREKSFSSLTLADRQYASKLEDLQHSHDKKLRALNFAYQADSEALRKQQIDLLESGKSAAMKNEDLDAAIAIRDRIVELQSAEPVQPQAMDLSTPKNFATVWQWDRFPHWRLVFQGDDKWIEGDRSHWTETSRSTECIYLHDEERNMFGMLYHNAFFYRQNFEAAWTMVSGKWVKAEAESSSNTTDQ